MTRYDAQPIARGRHRRRRVRRTWLVASGVLTLAATGAIGVFVVHRDNAAASCRPPSRTLRVAAAPEIASVVSDLAREEAAAHACRPASVTVSAVDPARLAAGISAGATRPDVWIPDSSLWASRVPGGGPGPFRSIARSPIVVAVPTILRSRLGPVPTFRTLADSVLTAHPVRWLAADPGSTPQIGVLIALRAALAGEPTARATLTGVLRAMAAAPGGAGNALTGIDALTGIAAAPDAVTGPEAVTGPDPVAVTTTEQAVWALNTAHRSTVTAIYPPAPGINVDYPYIVLATDASARADAATFLETLASAPARAALQGQGFRASDGVSGPELTGALGVDPAAPATGPVPSPAQAQATVEALATLNRPSRLLAVIDVSGSMATPVPGRDGGSRLDLAHAAAARALGLFSADSVVGLWEFSANLTPASDHRELAPLTPLSPPARAKLAGALDQLAVIPDGGTGLYDTVLAAVRAVRSGYDPSRVNTVVVLSDGKDEDDADHGITLPALLQSLQAEDDPARPVPVITIAYGPDSDEIAMRTISMATGGAPYTSKDPADLPQVFLDAIGQRLCRPHC